MASLLGLWHPGNILMRLFTLIKLKCKGYGKTICIEVCEIDLVVVGHFEKGLLLLFLYSFVFFHSYSFNCENVQQSYISVFGFTVIGVSMDACQGNYI